jgi:hypothetical protein
VSEPTTKLSAEDWRAIFVRSAEWVGWFLDKYQLAEDVQPDEVDAVIRADALAEVAPPPALDAERVFAICGIVGGVDPENPEGWRDFAIEFAREYARLATSTDTPEAER